MRASARRRKASRSRRRLATARPRDPNDGDGNARGARALASVAFGVKRTSLGGQNRLTRSKMTQTRRAFTLRSTQLSCTLALSRAARQYGGRHVTSAYTHRPGNHVDCSFCVCLVLGMQSCFGGERQQESVHTTHSGHQSNDRCLAIELACAGGAHLTA